MSKKPLTPKSLYTLNLKLNKKGWKMSDLGSYVRNLQKQGYTIQQIKQYLLKYGYPENVIDQTIYSLSHPTEIKHTIHITKTSLIAIAIMVIGIIITSFFVFRHKPAEQLLDVSIDSIDTEVQPGDFLTATIQLSNQGSQIKYDIYLKSEVFNEDTNERLVFKSETFALETEISHDFQIRIPLETEAGNYILQTTARLPGQSPKATAMFKIKKETLIEPTCSDNIQNQDEEDIDCGGSCQPCKKCPESCDDNDPLTIDTCDSSSNFECIHEMPAVCGDDICQATENTNTCPDDCIIPTTGTVWDELERIKHLANSDCSLAEQECNQIESNFKDKCLQNIGEICLDTNTCDRITDEHNRDRCFYNVAKASNKKIICENIQHEDRRNSCYIHFAVSGDYSVCDKITNEYVKRQCNILKETS